MRAQNTPGLLAACIILPLSTAVGPSGPTQPGAPADCTSWYSAKRGDSASRVASSQNIRLETFMDANPQLSGDPLALWEGYDYCIPLGSKTPPTQDSSDDTASSETGSTVEKSSATEEADSTAEKSSMIKETGSSSDGPSATSRESTASSQLSTASAEPGSNSELSTMTMEIAVPTNIQGGTQSEKESEGEKGSDGLAESFGAARRDLERTEKVEPKNSVTKRTGMDSLRDALRKKLGGHR